MAELPRHLATLSATERVAHEETSLQVLTADILGLLLEDLNISQAELARRLRMSEARVSKMLSGSQNLTLKSIARICTALGVRFRPHLVAGHRTGTPAADDAPFPDWVEGLDGAPTRVRIQYGDAHPFGNGADPSTTTPGWLRPAQRVHEDA